MNERKMNYDCVAILFKFKMTHISCNETWVYGYNPQTKQQSSQQKSLQSTYLKKARQVQSNIKNMSIIHFECSGDVHHKFVPIDSHSTLCRCAAASMEKCLSKMSCEISNWRLVGSQ
jgi:hypothetical protein